MSIVRKRAALVAGLAAFAGLSVPSVALADSISPSSYSTTLAVGGSATITKTVTVTRQATAPVDIFFLVDTTGSMGSTINNVKAGFADIVAALSGVASNVAFGVGEYKDKTYGGDAFDYKQDQSLTTSTSAVQTALNGLSAGGGGDTPEGNLAGLQGAATGAGWRAGSQRFLVWVGDAPGHDPVGAVTETTATNALLANDISVYSANATSGPGLDQSGQATRISNATGGSYFGTFNPADFTTTISANLTSSLSSYSSVGLTGVGVPSGVSVAFGSPIFGALDRSIERTFTFDVTFTGVTAGTYDFDIAALLSGSAKIASEHDHIVVGAGTGSVPEPASLSLLALGLAAACKRRFNRAA